MQEVDQFQAFGRRLAAAEQRFEEAKAELFAEVLTPDEFVERRAITRDLETALGQMHETRRRMNDLRRAPAGSVFDAD